MPEKLPKPWFVYMLECRGGVLYTGITVDVAARFAKHCAGRGAAFTRMNKPVRLVAWMACADRSEALREEYRVKRLPREEKVLWAAAASAPASDSVT